MGSCTKRSFRTCARTRKEAGAHTYERDDQEIIQGVCHIMRFSLSLSNWTNKARNNTIRTPNVTKREPESSGSFNEAESWAS